MSGLDRFKTAQHYQYAAALRELEAGRKHSHWIWFIFPQLDGLGSSAMARAFAIFGVDEAVEYLRDPVLRERLVAVTHAVASSPAPLRELMGSEIDARKLVSSMTLFGEVARRMAANEGDDELRLLSEKAAAILRTAAAEGLSPCAFTQAALASRLPPAP